jgi:hypothetical protein
LKLSWDASSMKGSYKPTLLMGTAEIAPLQVDDQGGVKDYAPLPALTAGETVIIQLRQ